MSIRGLLRRRRERSLGQSLVEFAIILPVFLVILSAAIDLGRLAYARVTIANVAREAAFQAANKPSTYQAGQPCPTKNPSTGQVPETNMVICRAILESSGSVITVAPSDITMTCTPSCNGVMGNTVTVKATGRFNLLTPIMAAFFGGNTITFSSSSTQQVNALPAVATTTTTTSTTTSTTTTTTMTTTTTSTSTTCTVPSAGFTFTSWPDDNKSPVTVTVTDTSTSSPSCPITVWAWNWGDGLTTYGKTQSPHTYSNTTGRSGNVRSFNLTLTVTSSAGTATSGVAIIQVVRP